MNHRTVVEHTFPAQEDEGSNPTRDFTFFFISSQYCVQFLELIEKYQKRFIYRDMALEQHRLGLEGKKYIFAVTIEVNKLQVKRIASLVQLVFRQQIVSPLQSWTGAQVRQLFIIPTPYYKSTFAKKQGTIYGKVQKKEQEKWVWEHRKKERNESEMERE